MALKLKTLDLNCGIRLSDVYFRLKMVSYDSTNGWISYLGDFYITEKTRHLGEQYSIQGYYLSGHFKINPEQKGDNLFKLAYEDIKATAEKLRGKTVQEIEEENHKFFREDKDEQMIDSLYFYFLDCEDIDDDHTEETI